MSINKNNRISRIQKFKNLSNDEIKNYIRDLEIQKRKQELLNARLKAEENKISILTSNISKLDRVNLQLDAESKQTKKAIKKYSRDIVELKLELEKAKVESKLQTTKNIKQNIIVNAKILKDQEDAIQRLKAKKKAILDEQKKQEEKLRNKRAEIEYIRKKTINKDFESINDDLDGILDSVIASNSDKRKILSLALDEASQEVNKIESVNKAIAKEEAERVELLKTEMLNLKNLTGKTYTEAISINNLKTEKPKTSKELEEEVKLTLRLNKLVEEGTITEADKEREIANFRNANVNIISQDASVFKDRKKRKKEKNKKKWQKEKIEKNREENLEQREFNQAKQDGNIRINDNVKKIKLEKRNQKNQIKKEKIRKVKPVKPTKVKVAKNNNDGEESKMSSAASLAIILFAMFAINGAIALAVLWGMGIL